MSSAFDKLARPVQKWIRQQGWRELRDIQARSIRTICETNTDLIVAASTAGGKTVTVHGNSFFDPDGHFIELNEVFEGEV